MSADLGPGDILVALISDEDGQITAGTRYTCATINIVVPDHAIKCSGCGEVHDRCLTLVETRPRSPWSNWGYAPCVFRRIGGPGVQSEFMRQVLRPRDDLGEPVGPKVEEVAGSAASAASSSLRCSGSSPRSGLARIILQRPLTYPRSPVTVP